jgi:quinol monooxygenase YgiN
MNTRSGTINFTSDENDSSDLPKTTHENEPRAPFEVELTLVVLRFEASDPEALSSQLANYVVKTRGAAGCRNVDWCQSVGRPGRFVVIEKWSSSDFQSAHFDSDVTQNFAQSCRGLLRTAPDIELLESISAHDLA